MTLQATATSKTNSSVKGNNYVNIYFLLDTRYLDNKK